MKAHAVFTTRHDGDMRQKKTPDTIYAQQIHGARVAVVSAADAGKTIQGADGLVSSDPVRLAVHAADCVPVLAWEETSGVVGAAHAGWRGTAGNITRNLIRAMCALGADPKNIRVAIGPHIGVCCYDVSEDRAQKFSGDGTRHVRHTWFIDLGKVNQRQCISAGVLPKHISVSDECTACNTNKYFSFRKDTKQTYGEQAGFIGFTH